MKFDKWQQEVINHKGSVTIRKGRQVGGSTAIGHRSSKLMLDYPGSNSLMIAPAQRQSSELFAKTLSWLMIEHERLLEAAGGYKEDNEVSARRNMELRRLFEAKHGVFAELPTKTIVKLKNGSKCSSLPAGKTGVYLRSFALDFLYVDEAAYVPDVVYVALKPMLLVSKKKTGLGWEVFLSTPFGKGGFFYDSFTDDDYLQFHISSEDCKRIDKADLRKEEKKITKMQYAQEYLGEFIDEFQQYFPTALIKKCMTFRRWNFKEHYNKGLRYYYGHDYAGPGKDENASVVAEMNGKKLKIVEPKLDDEPNTTIVNRKIVARDAMFKFRKLFVDSGGFGCGPTDELTNLLGRRVVGLNNAKKSVGVSDWKFGMKLNVENKIKSKILKEDLYSNARSMMERGDVEIIDDLMLLRSLKSMTFEYTADKNLKISGRCSHLAEAFVRVCWCVKEKGLNIYVY